MTVSAKALGPEGWGPSRNAKFCRCGHAKYGHARHKVAGMQSVGACQRTDCACDGYREQEAAA